MSTPLQPPGSNLTPEKIDSLVARWEHNRGLYPGWIVTPPDNRDTLWIYTRAWIEPILSRTEAEAPDRALIWLRELTWRCEMCLIPLWVEYAARIQDVLARIQPFSSLLNSLPGQLHPTPENSSVLNWGKLSESWIALALSLLRYRREALSSSEFQELAKQLLSLSEFDSRINSFVFYQRCLLALERLDYGGARRSVADWERVNESDPFWLSRRAAIRAEIGDIDSAKKEADSALLILRQAAGRSLLPGSSLADLYSLSREGWIMALLRGIKASRRFSAGHPIEVNLGRWDQLAALRCNPWVDLEKLEAILSAQPRKALPPIERYRGGVRLHFVTEGIVERLKPALQAARLLEDSGYPVRLDYIGLAASLLKRAVEWLSDELPDRALLLLLRLSDDEALRTFLSDHRVALFEPKTADVARATATEALEQAVTDFIAVDVTAKPGSFFSAERRAKIALELLQAFAVTLDDQNLAILTEQALSVRQNARVTRDHGILTAIDRLISRSLLCMSAQERSNHLLSVISQPLLGVDVTTITGSWTEDAATKLRWPTATPDRSTKSQDWSEAVRRLLRFAAEGPETARAQAIFRCGFLNRVGALEESERRELRRIVWADPLMCRVRVFPSYHLGTSAATRTESRCGCRGIQKPSPRGASDSFSAQSSAARWRNPNAMGNPRQHRRSSREHSRSVPETMGREYERSINSADRLD